MSPFSTNISSRRALLTALPLILVAACGPGQETAPRLAGPTTEAASVAQVGSASIAPDDAGATDHNTSSEAPSATSTAFDQDHGAWTELLEQYVSAGHVDYAGIKATGRSALDAYLATLEAVDAAQFATWSESEKMAYWINVYNAYTVWLILDQYPVKSIRSIGLLPGAAWRKKIVPLKALRGGDISLNDVEHEILRKEFEEPRIHFAIVCASISCPALRPEAYRGADLEAQLEDATRIFLGDETKNRYADGKLNLSSIFDWFREDFERDGQTLYGFVAPYFPELSAADPAPITFMDYDWSLNGK